VTPINLNSCGSEGGEGGEGSVEAKEAEQQRKLFCHARTQISSTHMSRIEATLLIDMTIEVHVSSGGYLERLCVDDKRTLRALEYIFPRDVKLQYLLLLS
jgi:hypothetical protein